LLGHRLDNGALVYPSQGGRYSAEGCMLEIAVSLTIPLGNQATPHCM
jgi:hypothetical protein